MTSNEIQKVKSTAFQSLSVLTAAMVFARQPLSPLPPIRPMSVCLCLLTASTSNVNLFVPGRHPTSTFHRSHWLLIQLLAKANITKFLRRWRYNTEVIPKLKSNCNSIPQPTWPSCTFACRTVLWVHNLPTAPNMVASRPFISACLCVHHLLALGLRQAQYVFIGLLC